LAIRPIAIVAQLDLSRFESTSNHESTSIQSFSQNSISLSRQGNGILSAIEVKLFRRTKGYYSTPFYEGIGQALAMLGYGFDHVALWYLFQEKDLKFAKNAYGSQTWHFIRNALDLPLDFSFFAIRESGNKLSFDVMKFTGEDNWVKLCPLDDPRFRITWKHKNPLRNDDTAAAIREGLDLWLMNKLP